MSTTQRDLRQNLDRLLASLKYAYLSPEPTCLKSPVPSALQTSFLVNHQETPEDEPPEQLNTSQRPEPCSEPQIKHFLSISPETFNAASALRNTQNAAAAATLFKAAQFNQYRSLSLSCCQLWRPTLPFHQLLHLFDALESEFGSLNWQKSNPTKQNKSRKSKQFSPLQ